MKNPFARKYDWYFSATLVVLPMAAVIVTAVLLAHGAIHFTWLDGALLAVMYSLTMIGIGAGFHRLFSHRAYKASPGLRLALVIFGSMAGQGTMFYWAASHRRHHQHSDQSGDVHSPHVKADGELGFMRGLWHSHVGWLFEAEDLEWAQFVPDLIRDRPVLIANRLYFLWLFLGLVLPAAIGGAITRSWTGALEGFLWGGLVRMFIAHHSVWSINSICHLIGSRPYASGDKSRNNWLVALLTYGEGWHNNHHAFPAVYTSRMRWWQIDLNGMVIRLLKRAGLASDLRELKPHRVVETAPSGT